MTQPKVNSPKTLYRCSECGKWTYQGAYCPKCNLDVLVAEYAYGPSPKLVGQAYLWAGKEFTRGRLDLVSEAFVEGW